MTERKQSKTVRIYETEPELHSFEATVLSCTESEGKYNVTLDRTAFFPTGGGQSCDTGMIGDTAVLDVSLVDNDVVHTLSSPLEVGSTVKGELDYALREKKMQSHTAEHILSSILFKRYGMTNVGFHIGTSDTTCDFDGMLTYAELCSAEDEVNAIIRENHVVYSVFPSDDELSSIEYRSKLELVTDVRLVLIGINGSVDKCACCAPHVTSTGRIGLFKITDFYRYKGGMRVHILTGQNALEKVRSDCEGIKELSVMLSAKPFSSDVVAAVNRLEGEKRVLKNEISELNLKLNNAICASLDEGKNICLFDARTDAEALRRLALSALEKTGRTVAVFGGNEGNYRFVLCGENAKGLFELLKASISIKGGGRDVICGTVNAKENEIRAVF